jgi:hypothetical protein
MRSISLDDTPYLGTTSRPAAEAQRTRSDCSRCGSSLAGRFEGTQRLGRQVVDGCGDAS